MGTVVLRHKDFVEIQSLDCIRSLRLSKINAIVVQLDRDPAIIIVMDGDTEEWSTRCSSIEEAVQVARDIVIMIEEHT
jgi:hypothetical protein